MYIVLLHRRIALYGYTWSIQAIDPRILPSHFPIEQFSKVRHNSHHTYDPFHHRISRGDIVSLLSYILQLERLAERITREVYKLKRANIRHFGYKYIFGLLRFASSSTVAVEIAGQHEEKDQSSLDV